jgi:glycerophosphodiester phosphodiesterase
LIIRLTAAQRQVKEGIDAVIVDSVLAIRKGLTSADATTEPQKDGDTTIEEAVAVAEPVTEQLQNFSLAASTAVSG